MWASLTIGKFSPLKLVFHNYVIVFHIIHWIFQSQINKWTILHRENKWFFLPVIRLEVTAEFRVRTSAISLCKKNQEDIQDLLVCIAYRQFSTFWDKKNGTPEMHCFVALCRENHLTITGTRLTKKERVQSQMYLTPYAWLEISVSLWVWSQSDTIWSLSLVGQFSIGSSKVLTRITNKAT